MKEVWKRILSLALCAVLLVSSVPVHALATEGETTETQAADPQPTEPAPTESAPAEPAETQPAPQPMPGEGSTASMEAANEVVGYDIFVNEEELSSEKTKIGDVSYSVVEGVRVLTLTGVDVESIKSRGTAELRIVLEAGAENKINKIKGLYVNGNVTITGTGALEIQEINTKYLVGSDGGALTVDAVVKVDSGATMLAITTNQDVNVTEKAHLIIDGDTYAVKAEQTHEGAVKAVLGNGYYRTSTTEAFAEAVQASGAGKYVEFVGKSHLTGEVGHVNDCPDTCKIAGKIVIGGHTEKTAATCKTQAKCSVCGMDYGELNTSKHEGSAVWVYATSTNHKRVYNCCGADEGTENVHTKNYSASGNVITVSCVDCNTTSTLTLTAEGGTYNGMTEFEAGYAPGEELMEGIAPEILYKDADGKELDRAPVNVGNYTASITVKDAGDAEHTASVSFEVKAKSIERAAVEIQGGSYEYDGTEKKPTVTSVILDGKDLSAGIDYEVTWQNNINVGTETAKPTVVVKGKGNYTGTATKEFEIVKAATSKDFFECNLPKSKTYDGNAVSAEGKVKDTVLVHPVQGGMVADEFKEIVEKYYKNGTLVVGQDGNPVTEVKDAGVYTVKLDAISKGNYEDLKDIENEEWTFEITKAEPKPVQAEAVTQKILVGTDVFSEPSFTGLDGAALEGSLTYKIGDDVKSLDFIKQELRNLKPEDAGLTFTYTFTPTDSNYGDSKPAECTIQAVDITFKVGEDEVTAENVLDTTNNAVYGNPNPVTLKAITATDGTKTDSDQSHFRVILNPEVPTVGSNNKFTVMYTDISGTFGLSVPVEVASGTFTVSKKKPNPTVTAVTGLTADGTEKELVTVITDGGVMQYKLDGGGWGTAIPKASAPGVYTVYYKVEPDANHGPLEEKSVRAVILPPLVATYGDNLSDIDLGDSGFAWSTKNGANSTPVGNVGDPASERTFILDYFEGGQLKVPDISAVVTVNPKPIEIEIELTGGKHYRYKIRSTDSEAAAQEPDVKVKIKDSAGDSATYLDERQYAEPVYANNRYPGTATVTISEKAGANYTFTETTEEFYIFRPAYNVLDEDKDIPAGIKAQEELNTLAEVQDVLNTKIKSDDYPTTNMKYFNVLMSEWAGKNTEGEDTWSGSRDEKYIPTEKGYDITLPYSALGVKKDEHDFKVVVMDAATSQTLGTTAGGNIKIITATEEEEGLKFHLDSYAVVCVAWNQVAQKYTVKSAATSYGDLTFTVGTSTTVIEETKSTEAYEGDTITVKVGDIKSGYAISRVEYYDSNTTYDADKATDITADSDGNYVFKMPAYNTTIKVTFKTSKATNPRTGDSSHIQFWTGTMCFSALAAAALVLGRKKRYSK